MTETKFHLEDWMNYYDAKLDEEDLNHAIELYREGYPNAKINVSGDVITTHVEAGFALDMDMFFEDIVTGEEIENRSFTVAEFRYTVDYKLDDLKYDIDDIEKSLNQAIESGQSKFSFLVSMNVIGVRDVEITEIESHSLSKDLVERVGGEQAVVESLRKTVMRDLTEWTDTNQDEGFLQPPQYKLVRFICTIPAG